MLKYSGRLNIQIGLQAVSAFFQTAIPPHHSTTPGQPSSVNRQPSTTLRQPSTVNRHPSTIYHPPSTTLRQPLKTTLLTLASILLLTTTHAQPAGIDRATYYKVIQQGKKELIDKELALLESAPPEARQAFSGALVMRKAGTGGSPHQKLKLFRQGHRDLEAAIKKDPENVEYRFLRLIIQEHAPGILGYRDNLEEDSEIIRNNYQKLPAELRKLVRDYSKKSKNLKLQVS